MILSTITTDNITEANEFRTGVGTHWPFLYEPRRVVHKDLDIAGHTDHDQNPMIPRTMVLEPVEGILANANHLSLDRGVVEFVVPECFGITQLATLSIKFRGPIFFLHG